MNRKTVAVLAVVWMLIIVAIASSALTMKLVSGSGRARLVTGEEYEMLQRYARLDEVRARLMEDYYIRPDEDALILAAIRGMTASLGDPYTFYYTREEMEAANDAASGVYHGVGMLVESDETGRIVVMKVYPDTSAERDGVQAGDVLLAVDGTPVSAADDETYAQSLELFHGEDGTQMVLTVQRGEEQLDLTLTRGSVRISYVEYSVIEGDIGYVHLAQFSGDASAGFDAALEAFREAGVTGIVVDLRGNPGGLLTEVVHIADRVLPEGIITYTEDRYGNRTEELSTADYWDIPMTVLVDGNSASASELFTAAVQDHDRGTVVGTTTYGKGIVQTMFTFPADGAGMQLTTAAYYSPNGRSIHQTGVEPDVFVSDDPDTPADEQLDAAIAVLRQAGSPPEGTD